jgi:hypothetical protein
MSALNEYQDCAIDQCDGIGQRRILVEQGYLLGAQLNSVSAFNAVIFHGRPA